jgi:AraC-like DNA-binding protein
VDSHARCCSRDTYFGNITPAITSKFIDGDISITACDKSALRTRSQGELHMTENISDGERGLPALTQLREAARDICDIIPLTAEDYFHATTATVMVDNALLVDSLITPVQYDRTPTHVARGAIDHYQVALCMNGEMKFSSGRRELNLRPGDIWLIDMVEPNRTVLAQSGEDRVHLRSLVLPRTVLAPKMAHPDSANATYFSRDGDEGHLLASQFALLWESGSSEPSNLPGMIEAVAWVVAKTVGPVPDSTGDVERAERRLYLAVIKRHIETNLNAASLTADHLCRRFRISRASLYRLFEADGGLARFIQEQRLNRALRQLASASWRGQDLINLATDLQFSSASTFIRAFRRQFGVTPGVIRELAEAWHQESGTVFETDNLLHQLTQRRAASGGRGSQILSKNVNARR